MLFSVRHLSVLALVVLLTAYFYGMWLNIMPVDAAQYASISREMLESGEFLRVQHHHAPYLDKPPLLFWCSALSFWCWGSGDIAYRLPSVLAALWGIYATYRLAKSLYNSATARLAACLLCSSQAYFLFCHDIRTDTLLTSFVITAIWLFYEWLQVLPEIGNGKRVGLFLGACTAITLALLAKGPIGAAVPLLSIGSYACIARPQKQNWRVWLIIGFCYICLLLMPMFWGLYEQYGWYGIRFYGWEQSFGRITGENRWHNQTDALFFVHTFLWAFLPYSLLAIAAIGNHLYHAYLKVRETLRPNLLRTSRFSDKEVLSVGGFLWAFVALSFSHYKLPHYIFVLFPLAAIFTAATIGTGRMQERGWYIMQTLIGALLCALSLCLVFWLFPTTAIWLKVVFLLLCLAWVASLFMLPHKNDIPVYCWSSLLAIAILNLGLNTVFYPNLRLYESGYQAAILWREKKTEMPAQSVLARSYQITNHAFDFYTAQSFKPLNNTDTLRYLTQQHDIALYTDSAGLAELVQAPTPPTHIDTLSHFAVTRLNAKFLNPNTRTLQLQTRFLVWWSRPVVIKP